MTPEQIHKFASLELSDGQVLGVSLSDTELRVLCMDWREAEFTLIFHDVVGIEELGIIGEDLSHGSVDSTDPFIGRACRAAREDAEGFWCFALWSAWSGEPLMRVVARSFELEG